MVFPVMRSPQCRAPTACGVEATVVVHLVLFWATNKQLAAQSGYLIRRNLGRGD